MTRDNIIRMAREAGLALYVNDVTEEPYALTLERFAALVAAAEQKPISDVTEAVTKTVIEAEKLLCGKIGRHWQPSGMSIQTLVDELAALVAAEKDNEIRRLREALKWARIIDCGHCSRGEVAPFLFRDLIEWADQANQEQPQ